MTTTTSEKAIHAPELAKRDNNFDALRLLFALFVLIGHSYSMVAGRVGNAYIWVGGHYRPINLGILAHIGLMGFFVISGYLVSGSYLADPSLGRFLWKRILRIFPLFLVVAFLSVFVAGPLGSDNWRLYFHDMHPWKQLTAIAFLHVSFDSPHTFPHNVFHALNGPTWSLPVEFVGYLFIAVLGVTGMLRLRWPVAVCWAVLAATDVILARFLPHIGHITLFAPYEVNDAAPLYALFSAGAMIRAFPALRAPAAFAGYALLWLIGHRFGVGRLVSDLAFPAVILWMGENRIKLPRLRDDLSYGIYLTACPVQQLLIGFLRLDAPALIVSAILITGMLATLSWRFIESPMLTLKKVAPRLLLTHLLPYGTTLLAGRGL